MFLVRTTSRGRSECGRTRPHALPRLESKQFAYMRMYTAVSVPWRTKSLPQAPLAHTSLYGDPSHLQKSPRWGGRCSLKVTQGCASSLQVPAECRGGQKVRKVSLMVLGTPNSSSRSPQNECFPTENKDLGKSGLILLLSKG